MKKLLEYLTAANLTFSITELGCGMPVAHEFMSLSGASKVLKYANCPYGKDAQIKITGKNGIRSVSLLNTASLLENIGKYEADFDIVYSIQCGDDKEFHGYVGLSFEGFKIIYHMSVTRNVSKKVAGAVMVGMFKSIVYKHVLGYATDLHLIDGAFSHNSSLIYNFDPTLLPANFRSFVIDSSGSWMRTTEYLRGMSHLGLVKGSFNPFHVGHQQLVDEAVRQGYIPLLSLTASTVQGKITLVADLVSRAIATNMCCLIDSDNAKYINLIAVLRNIKRYNGIIGIFAGVDVYHKMEKALFDLSDVKFHIFHRDMTDGNVRFHQSKFADISSTKIREDANC